MAHEQMTLDLLQSVNDNTHQNQQRCSTKELGESLLNIEKSCKCRHNRNKCNK